MTTSERAELGEWGYQIDVAETGGRRTRIVLAGENEGKVFFGRDGQGKLFFRRERSGGEPWFVLHEQNSGISIYPASSETPIRCNSKAVDIPCRLEDKNTVEVERCSVEIKIVPLRELKGVATSPREGVRTLDLDAPPPKSQGFRKPLPSPSRRPWFAVAACFVPILVGGGWWTLRPKPTPTPVSRPLSLADVRVNVTVADDLRRIVRGQTQQLVVHVDAAPTAASGPIELLEVEDRKVGLSPDGIPDIPTVVVVHDVATPSGGRALDLVIGTTTFPEKADRLYLNFTVSMTTAKGTVTDSKQLHWEVIGAVATVAPTPEKTLVAEKTLSIDKKKEANVPPAGKTKKREGKKQPKDQTQVEKVVVQKKPLTQADKDKAEFERKAKELRETQRRENELVNPKGTNAHHASRPRRAANMRGEKP